MELKEIQLEGVDWIHLVQDRDYWGAIVNTIVTQRFLYNARKFFSS
jgi:hypothetical protein